MSKPLPSQDYLRRLLDYDPETGKLYWLPRPESMFANRRSWILWSSSRQGKEAFTYISGGYRVSNLPGYGGVKAHRIIWKMVHGDEPEFIDHINHDRADNRLENLRAVSKTENARNRSGRRDRITGIYRHQYNKNRWTVKIRCGERLNHVGYFDCIGKAIAARREAERAHGYHPNHGVAR